MRPLLKPRILPHSRAHPNSSDGFFSLLGGFNKDVERRYADMELLIREFNESAVDGTEAYGGQPARAKKALLRLNAIHAKYSNIITYRCVRGLPSAVEQHDSITYYRI